MELQEAIGQRLLLAFEGKDAPSEEFRAALRAFRPAGVTLFRHLNIETPAQVRALTFQLQEEARALGLPRLLIAADQEGGQLMAIGEGVTPLPGNMALGAARSEDLAFRAGQVLGRELAAMGINVNYAPSVDVNVNPRNPVIGVRSFGEDPLLVAQLGAAMVAGIQSQGVAATAKHFPGHGDTTGDSHHGLPSLPHSLERLRAVELPPFRAAIAAGVQLVMSAHLALPALDGENAPPATLSPNILQTLLRRELGFEGVIVSDAMDMRAIRQDRLGVEAVRAARAGVDLLLLTANSEGWQNVHAALLQAARKRQMSAAGLRASAYRVLSLRAWLNARWNQPPLEAVGSSEHRQVAEEIAKRAITLVRDPDRLLPLRPSPGQRIGVFLPRPINLTPADTSASVTPSLARFLREYHPNVEEFLFPFAPTAEDIAALREQARQCDYLVIGTLNAFQEESQLALVRALLETGLPSIVTPLRLPYDAACLPVAATVVCTYSILEPSLHALAQAIFGELQPAGRLPVSLPAIAIAA
ncbi:MAG: glycoside hydrolase family 3 protein [Anaerolineales bacterium]|nr:glycoside hydrolase family 3 protein [Anaerolineales bacterium]MDW8278441.1 glycoside hydrolase family 3 N-terminal domain-containing protein [Anaerolineales bacterium]